MELVTCYLISFDTDTGQYFVRPTSTQFPEAGYRAFMLSPVPFDSQGGFKGFPDAALKQLCVCIQDGNLFYIVGFMQPRGPIIRDSAQLTIPLEAGESRWGHKSGSFMSMLTGGVLALFAHPWAHVVIDPIKQRLYGKLANLFIHLYAGYITYDAEPSQFKFEIKKHVDLSLIDNKKLAPEFFQAQIGTLDNNHLVNVELAQDVQKDGSYNYNMSLQLGKQIDNTVAHLESISPAAIVRANMDSLGNVELQATTLSLHNEKGVSLAKLLTDLIKAIENITVITPSGNSEPILLNYAEFKALKERLDTFII